MTRPNKRTEAALRLLQAADHGLEDAQVKTISAETRFCAAFRALSQTAFAVMRLFNERVGNDADRLSALMTLPEFIPFTSLYDWMGEASDLYHQWEIVYLQGGLVTDEDVLHCLQMALRARLAVQDWLAANSAG